MRYHTGRRTAVDGNRRPDRPVGFSIPSRIGDYCAITARTSSGRASETLATIPSSSSHLSSPKTAREAIDRGVPVSQVAGRAGLTKGIQRLAKDVRATLSTTQKQTTARQSA